MTTITKNEYIEIDVIVPVHNAADTLQETVDSAMHQIMPSVGDTLEGGFLEHVDLTINVCCYDDGSTDKSWEILRSMQQQYSETKRGADPISHVAEIPSRLLIAKSHDGLSRGAGFARNRAAELSKQKENQEKRGTSTARHCIERFLCLLDSDDIMHPRRVVEQVTALMKLPPEVRRRTLLGCKVQRDPPDSTWHYTRWANSLKDERLMLEKFRECTLLQPTWFMASSRFEYLGGYIEGPQADVGDLPHCDNSHSQEGILRLIHPTFDTPETLRLAEDLRFFHAHLHSNGLLSLHRPSADPDLALVTYRHRANQSQSFRTSRKLLLHLRALAFEKCILEHDTPNQGPGMWSTTNHKGAFVVWGAGRDGKDFVKALSADARKRVYCFVDVDANKIQQGFYSNQEIDVKIPIVHFSLLAKSEKQRQSLLESNITFGHIDKSKPESNNKHQDLAPRPKKPKTSTLLAASPKVTIDLSILPELPVVVLVSMYRTNGALEANVKTIERVEGEDLWHFS